jgi:hypothetical protein
MINIMSSSFSSRPPPIPPPGPLPAPRPPFRPAALLRPPGFFPGNNFPTLLRPLLEMYFRFSVSLLDAAAAPPSAPFVAFCRFLF